jgi:hypothetical protein
MSVTDFPEITLCGDKKLIFVAWSIKWILVVFLPVWRPILGMMSELQVVQRPSSKFHLLKGVTSYLPSSKSSLSTGPTGVSLTPILSSLFSMWSLLLRPECILCLSSALSAIAQFSDDWSPRYVWQGKTGEVSPSPRGMTRALEGKVRFICLFVCLFWDLGQPCIPGWI